MKRPHVDSPVTRRYYCACSHHQDVHRQIGGCTAQTNTGDLCACRAFAPIEDASRERISEASGVRR